MKKDDSMMWLLIAGAVIAGIYFYVKRPTFTTSLLKPAGSLPPSYAGGGPSYLTQSGVSDIINNLSADQGPLQLTPPDNTMLKPLNLDLVKDPGSYYDNNTV